MHVDLGDNGRAARVLFVQHPREQGDVNDNQSSYVWIVDACWFRG